jgi:LPS export ABC transporter permease LptG/LPS export ABC transporter permease LptF
MIPPAGLGLLIYSFVLLADLLLRYPEWFISRGVPFAITVKLLVYLIPGIIAFTIPMSIIMGILAGLARLSSDSEVVAFKGLGVSHGRMLRPVAFFALAGWLLTSALTLVLAPFYNFKWQQTLSISVVDKLYLQLAPREFNESMANLVVYLQDARGKDWEKVLLAFLEDPEESKIVLARRGKLNFYPDSKRATIELEDAVQHTLRLDEPEAYGLASLARLEEEINIDNLLGRYTAEKRVREKNIFELAATHTAATADRLRLSRERDALEARGLRKDQPDLVRASFAVEEAERLRRAALVEIHKRFSLPFVCWVFVFLGLPLGVSTKKGGRTSGFTVSLVVILAYYVFITAGENMALNGRIAPWLGMWGGNIVLGLASVILFIRSARERPFRPIFGPRPRAPKIPAADRRRAGTSTLRFGLNPPFPDILDRYVIRRYLFLVVLILVSILAVSAIVTFFDRLDDVYEHKKPISLLLAYIGHRVPEFLHLGIPVTALLATLLTLGLFAKFNEITAMKACGISLYRVIVPIVLMAVLAGGLAFWIQERVLPSSGRKAEAAWDRILDRPPRLFSAANRRWIVNRARDRFYHFDSFNPETLSFGRFWIEEMDTERWRLRRRTFADRARIDGDGLRLEAGWTRSLGEGAMSTAAFETFAERRVPLEDGRSVFLRETKEPAQMTLNELKGEIRNVEGLGYDTTRLRVDLAVKTSFPATALIMTFLAVPFAFSMGRRGTLVGVGVGLAIAIVYWVAIGIFRSLGYAGMLTVFLGAWGPNLIFGLLGLYGLLRLRT